MAFNSCLHTLISRCALSSRLLPLGRVTLPVPTREPCSGVKVSRKKMMQRKKSPGYPTHNRIAVTFRSHISSRLTSNKLSVASVDDMFGHRRSWFCYHPATRSA